MKPLLAETLENVKDLKYPCLVSPKLDGIRCLIIDGVAMSRSLKPIRNAFVQKEFGLVGFNGLDGELIVGEANAKDVYRTTNSGVMSEDGEPDVYFHVFDRFDLSGRFTHRYSTLPRSAGRVVRVPQHHVTTEQQLLDLEQQYLEQGYEGLMLRHPDGLYKHGRSTLKEGTLLKLKRFQDDEFEVVGFEERMHNGNAATKNALGHTERSMHQSGMVGRGDLGALILKHPLGTFNVGTGFDDATRLEIWHNKDKYLGKAAKIKHFAIGVKDFPRFPVYLGIRDGDDK